MSSMNEETNLTSYAASYMALAKRLRGSIVSKDPK